MQLDRDALFSPASSSILARVLPSLFLDLRENEDAIITSIDVKDAFLTVDQQTPTVVRCQMADGQTVEYQLGKVLPGDELTFLQGTVTLQHDGRLTIQTHHKHLQHLCELLKMNPTLQSKKAPGHSDMDQTDETPDLDSADAAVFRTCVGVLLYLAADLPHCQHVVRHLATYSTRPSQKSLVVLRHLVGYLASHESVCVSLKWKGRAMCIYHKYELPPGEVVLEVFTDSDWASDRTSRRCAWNTAETVGRLRHVSCRILWLQALVMNGTVKLSSVAGVKNPANIGAKRLAASRMRSLMAMLGMYNLQLGCAEGSEDPAGIFRKKQNVMSILSALSLLQLRGCDPVDDSGDHDGFSACIIGFTVLLGFAVFLFMPHFFMQPVAPLQQLEPDAGTDVMPPVSSELDGGASTNAPANNDVPNMRRHAVEPTPEGYIAWLIERCERRYNNAETRERRILYARDNSSWPSICNDFWKPRAQSSNLEKPWWDE
eukprot:s4053_g8.t1